MRRVSNGPPVGSVNAVLLRLYAVAWTLPGAAQRGRNAQEGDSSITDTYDTSANEVLTAPLSCLKKQNNNNTCRLILPNTPCRVRE